jgi:hypothetical protein
MTDLGGAGAMTAGLYLSEPEIARFVLGPKRITEWRGIAAILERDGFPKVDPLFGGRYAPAVRAWLDAYNRVANITPPRRGKERWPEVNPQERGKDR